MKNHLNLPASQPDGTKPTLTDFFEAVFENYGLNVSHGHPGLTDQELQIALLHGEIFLTGQLKTLLEQATNSYLFPKRIEYLERRRHFFGEALSRAEALRDEWYNSGEGAA